MMNYLELYSGIFIKFRQKINKKMEITWNKITESEKVFHYKNIFSNYDLYVNSGYTEIELANIIGSSYFLFNLCLD